MFSFTFLVTCSTGPGLLDISSASNWSVNFEFGCQESETGLFRTQNVDGIMGMSAAEDTLPYQLVAHRMTRSRVFAMCFKPRGGVLTLGGVDTALHGRAKGNSSASGGELQFAKLTKPKGWFTVKVLDVAMRRPGEQTSSSIGGPIFKMNGGKGTIVDSGTTDTYLPSALAASFKALFLSMTGLQHSNNVVQLSVAQFALLPTLLVSLEGVAGEGSRVTVEVPPLSYMEHMKGDRYASRVYLTEHTGSVLGANFMNLHNVVFDIDNLRIGFAPSDCEYKTTAAQDLPRISQQAEVKTVGSKASQQSSLLQQVDNLLPF